jgi:hypothetical protein
MKSLLIAMLGAVALAGCGKEIGDACIVSSDCSTDGSRICDTAQKEGYCTIQGCDFDTCPDEATCVRFFTGSFANEPCMDATQCTLDELCTLPGFCAPRSAEVRYCMRKCDSDSDCRDGYECRDYNRMIDHGGEPVLSPGVEPGPNHAPKFCALKPTS